MSLLNQKYLLFLGLLCFHTEVVFCAEEDCSSRVDVVFVVDGSGSVGDENFDKVRRFLAMIVDGLPDDALIAAVQFSTEPQVEFDYNDYPTRQGVRAAVLSLWRLRGQTYTGDALDLVYNELRGAESGNRDGVADIVIVLTDGKSRDEIQGPAKRLRDSGALILAVGVGRANEDELVLMTGGDESLVFKVDDFDALNHELSQEIMKRTMCVQVDDPNLLESCTFKEILKIYTLTKLEVIKPLVPNTKESCAARCFQHGECKSAVISELYGCELSAITLQEYPAQYYPDDPMDDNVYLYDIQCANAPATDDFICEGREDGTYANPFDACSPVWFTCQQGERQKHHCNRGKRYDLDSGYCLLPQYVPGCGGEPTVKPKPTLPTFEFDCNEHGDGDYENPLEPCSQYYITCANGVTYTRACPGALMFESYTDSCQPKSMTEACGGTRPKPSTPSGVDTVPPEVFDCSDRLDGNFPDPAQACSRTFYSCTGGYAFERSCNSNTFFDVQDGVCLFRDYVAACGGAATQSPNVTTGKPTLPPPFPFNCVGIADGSYPHPVLECSPDYVTCSNGHAIYLRCPVGLDFDVKSQKCLHRQYILYCGGLPTEPQTPSISTTKPPPFPFNCRGRADGLYAHQCSPHFAICSGEKVNYEHCPDLGLMAFDTVSQQCLLKEYVGSCGGTATTPSPPDGVSIKPPFAFDCSGVDDGSYGDPVLLCSADYVTCSNGHAIYLRCPAGLNFDVDSQNCLQRQYILYCGGIPTKAQTPSVSTTKPPPFQFNCQNRADGLYSQQCSPHFASCSGEKVQFQRCPNLVTMAFDTVSQQCLLKAYVSSCGGISTTTTPPDDSTNKPPPFEFECKGRENGFYPNPAEPCSSDFAACSHGRADFLKCFGMLKFDPPTGQCLGQEEVGVCGGSSTSKRTTPLSSSKPPVDFECSGSEDGFFQDPRQPCSQTFYACVGVTAHELNCAGNTYFDSISGECLNKPYIESCGGVATAKPTPSRPNPDVTATPPAFDCWNLDDGKYAPPGVICPSFFYYCEQRDTYKVECPGSSRFNGAQCTHPIQVPGCLGSPTGFCENRINGGYRDEADCRNYRICADGFEWRLSCVQGQVFDPETGHCKYPSEVFAPCGNKGPRNYLSCEHKKNGFYRGEDSCSVYCECNNGTKYIHACQEGYAYDPIFEICVPAISVPGCRIKPDLFFDSYCAEVGRSGLYAHLEICSSFIICLQEIPLVFDCSATVPPLPFFSEVETRCVEERPEAPQCRHGRKRRNIAKKSAFR